MSALTARPQQLRKLLFSEDVAESSVLQLFMSLGGLGLLARLFVKYTPDEAVNTRTSVGARTAAGRSRAAAGSADGLRRLQMDSLLILRECAYGVRLGMPLRPAPPDGARQSATVAETLARQDALVVALFVCLRVRELVDVAGPVLEELLASRKTVFDLRKVVCLPPRSPPPLLSRPARWRASTKSCKG
jgi:hypothetical protein